MSTGNKDCASFVCKSNDIVFVFTAPYGLACDASDSDCPHPGYDRAVAHKFVADHGLAVRAMGIQVGDAEVAYNTAVANGAVPLLSPQRLTDNETGEVCLMSEVRMFDDTVMRFISGNYSGVYLPKYVATPSPEICYGLKYIDHAVSNVPNMFAAVDYMTGFTGFHEFGEFTAADVGTVDSGLNSMVLANNNQRVLLPINEPTFGTRRKSQIQTYLEQNCGAGIQHIALKTDDILKTMKEMRDRSYIGGMEFMPQPDDGYYERTPARIGADSLSAEFIAECKKLGLLIDKDDQGILVQVFTKPLGDRPTVFIEIIQRIGCDIDPVTKAKVEQAPGCGGFGKGNFAELFKSIEDFERTFDKKEA